MLSYQQGNLLQFKSSPTDNGSKRKTSKQGLNIIENLEKLYGRQIHYNGKE